VTSEEAWELHAQRWLRWARTPGHDAYWHYRSSFLDELLPPPGRLTVEVGCGEGRVSRDLAARGHRVLGVDASPTLIGSARAADPAGRYVHADAGRLPLADASADLVVAYNSLMDMSDLPGAVAEAWRVLEPGTTLCACVSHPLAGAGHFEGREPDARFVVEGSYLQPRRLDDTFARDGLEMTFAGWSRPLAAYAGALEAAGFLIRSLREPAASAAAAAARDSYRRWQRVPMFLHIVAVKPR
jgi:SAM-dependent methyltransferase